jgi:hypothetical protein
MSTETGAASPAPEQTYPVSQKFNVSFSALEDRLIVRADRIQTDPVIMLLTRRMTMLVLQQVIARLPEMSALDKTPAAYWQEVLQMSHQQAMQAKTEADKKAAAAKEADTETKTADAGASSSAPKDTQIIYLATELTLQLDKSRRLTMAFRGLLMPEAMTQSQQHQPVLAIPLTVDNVHQLIELLIVKCQEAQWNLPLDLPWLSPPAASSAPTGGIVLAH